MRSEYVVHGHFLLSRNDQNPKPNAFWVPLHKMLKDVGDEAVKMEIDIFTAQAEDMIQQELLEYLEDEDESDQEAGGGGGG